MSYCPNPTKDYFECMADAKRAKRQMQKRGRYGKKTRYSPVEPYKCRCGGFHLATQWRQPKPRPQIRNDELEYA